MVSGASQISLTHDCHLVAATEKFTGRNFYLALKFSIRKAFPRKPGELRTS